MSRLAPWSLVLACFAVGGACSSDDKVPAGLAEGCILNTDCASPLVCAFRKCHQACETSRDCGLGQRCVASERPLHVCQLATERDCSYNSDCPTGQFCGIDLQCRDQCLTDRDCVRDQLCVGGTCADVAELHDGELVSAIPDAGTDSNSGRPCLYTSECDPPLICKSQICSRECLAAADCNQGFDCVNNRCVAGSGTLIGPEGGTVTASSGKIKLTIPPGSLGSAVSILILPVEAWPEGALGPVFQLEPTGLAFAAAATLTYRYTAADVGAVAPAMLQLANAVGAKWVPLASKVDATGSTVTAELNHLSIYGLVAAPSDAGADSSALDGNAGGDAGAGATGDATIDPRTDASN